MFSIRHLILTGSIFCCLVSFAANDGWVLENTDFESRYYGVPIANGCLGLTS